MNFRFRTHCLVTILASINLSAQAAFPLKEGTWELHYALSSADGSVEKNMQQMREKIASLDTKERQVLEMLFASQGKSLSDYSGTHLKSVFCIETRHVQSNLLPLPALGRCQAVLMPTSTASNYTLQVSCIPNQNVFSGNLTTHSPESYSIVINNLDAKHKTVLSSLNGKASWKAQACKLPSPKDALNTLLNSKTHLPSQTSGIHSAPQQ